VSGTPSRLRPEAPERCGEEDLGDERVRVPSIGAPPRAEGGQPDAELLLPGGALPIRDGAVDGGALRSLLLARLRNADAYLTPDPVVAHDGLAGVALWPADGKAVVGVVPDRSPPGAGNDDDDCVELGYRTVRFCVPRDWLTDYVADWTVVQRSGKSRYESGLVSSQTATLEALWSTFRAADRGDSDAIRGLLACYNLPRGELADSALFWSNGWGPPYKVFQFACKLLRTYWDDIEYDDGPGLCAGLGRFVRDALDGEEVERAGGDTARCVSVNYRNAEVFPRAGPSCYRDADCDIGFQVTAPSDGSASLCDGHPWDEYEMEWKPGWWCLNGLKDGAGCSPPESDCKGYAAFGGSWEVAFPPNDLAWRGAVCDYQMFLARLAYDYARYLGARLQWGAAIVAYGLAVRLARYALLVIARHARTMLHELGHCYLRSGHCTWGCYFEIAAQHWYCQLRARLGLPLQTYEPLGDDDFEPGELGFTTRDGYCGSTEGVFYMSCTVADNGVEGSRAEFCATPYCITPLESVGDLVLINGDDEVVYSVDDVEADFARRCE
jgi:hypothetical protein